MEHAMGAAADNRLEAVSRRAAIRVDRPVRPHEPSATADVLRMSLPVRVLVVDPDEDTADSLANLLSLFGCWVRVARNRATAEAEVERFRPHLLVTDIDTRSEIEMVRHIRARSWGTHVRIAAHTGWTGEQVQAEAHTAGCNDFLVKPVLPAVFRRLIGEVADSVLMIPGVDG